MSAELRDFAQSILRMDGERVRSFERAQELAKKCDALVVERDTALAERDTLRGAVDHWHDSSINERVNGNTARKERDEVRDELHEACAERDRARAELAGVTAQRDAHLSRSVELAARVTELEARLAAVTPAVDEVDGFRAGDLVCHKGCAGSPGGWGRVITLGKRIEANFGRRGLHTYLPNELERKPVEVGDAVREVHSGLRGEVFKANEYAFDVRRPTGQMSSWSRDNCIAIAPTVKP